jgi:hypothetical protein
MRRLRPLHRAFALIEPLAVIATVLIALLLPAVQQFQVRFMVCVTHTRVATDVKDSAWTSTNDGAENCSSMWSCWDFPAWHAC